MLKDYYYTDKEELDTLRAENAKLRANITNLANLETKYKKEVRLMETKKTKKTTYTKDQVRDLLAEVLAELAVELKDPSLVIAGTLAMCILDKKFK